MAIVAQPLDDIGPTAPIGMPTWRRWLITFLLLTGGIKTTMAFTTVVPALPSIAEHFKGHGDNILGAQMMMTLATAGMALAGLFAGWLITHAGLRSVLFIALALSSVCGLSELIIEDFYLLLASRFLLGASVVTVDVALTTILAAEFGGTARSQVVGFRQALSSSGTVLTMLLSGYLVQSYGWRAPAWMFVFPAVSLLLALIAFNKPITVTRHAQEGERFTIGQLWPIFLLCLLVSGTHTLPSLTMPFLLKENGIIDPVLISRPSALSAFIAVIAATGFGLVYNRVGRWTLVMAATFMGVGFIGVGFAPSYNLILAWVVIEGIGAGWTMPYFSSRLLDRVTPAQRSQAMGMLLTAMFLGGIAQPLATAPIRHVFGIHATFIAVGGALVAGAVLLACWALAKRNRESMI